MPNRRTGVLVYASEGRLVGANAAARELLGDAVQLGAARPDVEGVGGDELPQAGDWPSVSVCRLQPTPRGPEAMLFNYRPQGERLVARCEPLEWTVGFADGLRDLVLVTDPGGRVCFANAAWAGRALSPPGLVGLSLAELAHLLRGDPTALAAMAAAALNGETLLLTGERGWPAWIVRSAPLRYCGRICGTLWTGAENAGERRDRQLLAALEYRLAAVYQHDLRNPLQTLQAAVDLGRLRTGAGTQAEVFDRIETALRQVAEVLQRPRLEGEPPACCLLSGVVSQEIERARGQFGTHRLRFSHAVPSQEPRVRCPVSGMGRVFANLFQNAGQCCQAGRIEVSYAWDQGSLTCAVGDDGPGFPHEVLAHALGREPDPKHGLGLALVRATVESCGGTVQIANGEGGGACVRLRLPRADAAG